MPRPSATLKVYAVWDRQLCKYVAGPKTRKHQWAGKLEVDQEVHHWLLCPGDAEVYEAANQ